MIKLEALNTVEDGSTVNFDSLYAAGEGACRADGTVRGMHASGHHRPQFESNEMFIGWTLDTWEGFGLWLVLVRADGRTDGQIWEVGRKKVASREESLGRRASAFEIIYLLIHAVCVLLELMANQSISCRFT